MCPERIFRNRQYIAVVLFLMSIFMVRVPAWAEEPVGEPREFRELITVPDNAHFWFQDYHVSGRTMEAVYTRDTLFVDGHPVMPMRAMAPCDGTPMTEDDFAFTYSDVPMVAELHALGLTWSGAAAIFEERRWGLLHLAETVYDTLRGKLGDEAAARAAWVTIKNPYLMWTDEGDQRSPQIGPGGMSISFHGTGRALTDLRPGYQPSPEEAARRAFDKARLYVASLKQNTASSLPFVQVHTFGSRRSFSGPDPLDKFLAALAHLKAGGDLKSLPRNPLPPGSSFWCYILQDKGGRRHDTTE